MVTEKRDSNFHLFRLKSGPKSRARAHKSECNSCRKMTYINVLIYADLWVFLWRKICLTLLGGGVRFALLQWFYGL